MKKDEIIALAKVNMLELSEDEIIRTKKEFEDFFKQLEILDKIDTTNVEPLDYLFDQQIMSLREDVSDDVLSVKQALSNASETSENMVEIIKVIK